MSVKFTGMIAVPGSSAIVQHHLKQNIPMGPPPSVPSVSPLPVASVPVGVGTTEVSHQQRTEGEEGVVKSSASSSSSSSSSLPPPPAPAPAAELLKNCHTFIDRQYQHLDVVSLDTLKFPRPGQELLELCKVQVHISDFWPSKIEDFVQRHVDANETSTATTPWSYRVGMYLQQPGVSDECGGMGVSTSGMEVVVFGQEAEKFFDDISPLLFSGVLGVPTGVGVVMQLKQLMFNALTKGTTVELILKMLNTGKYAIVGTRMSCDEEDDEGSFAL